ncbi:MAG: phage major capsid protein [Ruminococcaceae bacterium]|nr:phage major capsid protein [Oscillospiraceae bacterium]
MSDETVLRLRTLKDKADNYLWNEATETLLGKPVYTSPYMPDVAEGAKPVLFGDFSYYWFVERGALTLQPVHELYAENGVTAYIGSEFVDGKLIKQDAVKALLVADA